MTWRNINNGYCIFNSFVRRPSQQASARARWGAGGDGGKTTVLITAQNNHLILILCLHSPLRSQISTQPFLCSRGLFYQTLKMFQTIHFELDAFWITQNGTKFSLLNTGSALSETTMTTSNYSPYTLEFRRQNV